MILPISSVLTLDSAVRRAGGEAGEGIEDSVQTNGFMFCVSVHGRERARHDNGSYTGSSLQRSRLPEISVFLLQPMRHSLPRR